MTWWPASQARFAGTEQLNYDIAQMPAALMISTIGHLIATIEKMAPNPPTMFLRKMTGYEDLDDYGRWQYVAGYGNVWMPAGVASDWAPYRDGHWVWVEPWGWTWVEDEPWGFAPFHYGRWAYAENRWCWVPGPVSSPSGLLHRHWWRLSAVVASSGNRSWRRAVGWFPLAPAKSMCPIIA